MKNLIVILIAVFSTSFFVHAQEVECRNTYKKYELLYNKQQYQAAYPEWKKVFDACPKFVVNVYNHGDVILPAMIEATTGAEKEKHIQELFNNYEQRLVNYPENVDLYKADLVHQKLTYGKIDSLSALNEFKTLFNKAKAENTKLSATAMNTYFYTALNLYYYKKIKDDDFINVYTAIKEALDLNKELRLQEIAPLQDKLFGVTDTLGNVIKEKADLDYTEKQVYENGVANIDYYTAFDTVFAQQYEQYLNLSCESLDRIVSEGFEENKDNKEWLSKYYWLMIDKECTSPVAVKLNKRIEVLFPAKQVASSRPSGGVEESDESAAMSSSNARLGIAAYKRGSWNEAIKYLKLAIDESSSASSKGGYAVMIANSYLQLKSYSNAKTWAFKTLSYKPGYSSAYIILAQVYHGAAGTVSGSTFKKKAASWAAADMARRGGDSRLANQFDQHAPSSEECFREGVAKGSSVSVGGIINTTTTARCVK